MRGCLPPNKISRPFLRGLYGGVNDFGPLLQTRRTKQFCYQFGPRVSRLKHAGAASPFGHSFAQCAQKVSAEYALRESLALCGSGRIAEDEWSSSKMGAQVLVVDDEADQRSDLTEMVAALGFRVTTVADGAEALKKLITLSASAILTDLMMPRMDGFAPLKELAARGNRTPTIVLTAFGTIDQAISIVHYLKAFWFLEKTVALLTMFGDANSRCNLESCILSWSVRFSRATWSKKPSGSAGNSATRAF